MGDQVSLVFETRREGERRVSVAPMLSLDPDGTVRFANDAFRELTGFDRGAVVGTRLASLRADAADVDDLAAAAATEESVTRPVTVECADGSAVPVWLSGQAEAREGHVERIHCQLTPREESAATAHSPAAQSALLRTLLDGLPVGILAETADRTVLAVNDALVSMFDYPAGKTDLIGADCRTVAQEASEEFVDPAGFVSGIEDCIEGGQPVTGERLALSSGRVFERSYRPVALPNGQGHLWMYEDVTEQRARESELETYERLVDVAPVGVFRTTTDGRVLTANRRLADILGYDSERDLLENYEDLARDLYVDPRRRQTFLDRLGEAGEVEDFEYEARVEDGGRRWLSMNARLLEETDDGARVITGFTWDVTERRRHERQLAVLGRVLRHDLRNALTVIDGQAKLLADGTDAPEDARSMIADRTDSLLELADKEREIVEVLRGRTNLLTLDLSETARAVCATLRQEHPEATIEFSGAESAPVTACGGFERAVRELVENAVLHAESDEPTVWVSIDAGEDTTELAVKDDGPGLPDLERKVLRGQIDESPLYHSTGIGLFLVRQLAHCSNGTLSVEENHPRGSVVRIRLPSA